MVRTELVVCALRRLSVCGLAILVISSSRDLLVAASSSLSFPVDTLWGRSGILDQDTLLDGHDAREVRENTLVEGDLAVSATKYDGGPQNELAALDGGVASDSDDNFKIDMDDEEVDEVDMEAQVEVEKSGSAVDSTLLFSFMVLRALVAVRSVNSDSQRLMWVGIALASLSRTIYEGRDFVSRPSSLVMSSLKEFSHVYGLCYVLRFFPGSSSDDDEAQDS